MPPREGKSAWGAISCLDGCEVTLLEGAAVVVARWGYLGLPLLLPIWVGVSQLHYVKTCLASKLAVSYALEQVSG